jgi:hypothetical protein
MRLRFRPHLAALSLLIAGAAACKDESPVLTGDPFFPDGRPVTMEALLPAAEFLQLRGSFTNYTTSTAVPYAIVANQFDGALNAHALVRFGLVFPKVLEYTYNGTSVRDSLYVVQSARVVLSVDSTDSGSTIVPLSLHRILEDWDALDVTWTQRLTDSSGVHNWTTPGGTFGPSVGDGRYVPLDSLSTSEILLNPTEVAAMRADSTAYRGLLVAADQPGDRIQIVGASLRLEFRPSNAAHDTTIVSTSSATSLAFVYTPEPPEPAGFIRTGSVRGARTLMSVHFPDSLTVCSPLCDRFAMRDLALHRVSLLLRPVPAPGGFRLVDSAAVLLRTIVEPELGRAAPLGSDVVASFDPFGRPLPARRGYAPGDTLVELPFTVQAARMIALDTVPGDFALLGSTFNTLGLQPFSLQLFDAQPRLRIVFTLPDRPRLP